MKRAIAGPGVWGRMNEEKSMGINGWPFTGESLWGRMDETWPLAGKKFGGEWTKKAGRCLPGYANG